MENVNMNEFTIKEWDILPVDVYKILLDEIKENFIEYLSETKSITDKSIRLLTILITFISASGIYIFTKHSHWYIDIILGILSIINIIGIYNIFKGHFIHYNGMKPHEVLTSDFDDPEFSENDKNRLIYKNLIEQYSNKIHEMSNINDKRVTSYDNQLLFSIIIIITISCYLGFIW
jgi:hypothetical protein